MCNFYENGISDEHSSQEETDLIDKTVENSSNEITEDSLELEDKDYILSLYFDIINSFRLINQNLADKYSKLLNVILTFTGLLITALGVIIAFRSLDHLSNSVIILMVTYGLYLCLILINLLALISSVSFISHPTEITNLEDFLVKTENEFSAFDMTTTAIQKNYDFELAINNKISKNKKKIISLYGTYVILSVVFFFIVALLSKSYPSI